MPMEIKTVDALKKSPAREKHLVIHHYTKQLWLLSIWKSKKPPVLPVNGQMTTVLE